MDVISAITARSSAGRLAEPAPNSAQLEQVLRAAVHAPDHGRLSPWRFAVMHGASRQILADAMADLLARKHADATADMLAAEKAKAMRAPMIIAVAAQVTSGHKVPAIEQLIAVGAAIQNMLLAAQALGFGSMWKTGAPAYDAAVKQALGFAAADHIIGFVYLGTTAAPGKPRQHTLAGLVRNL
jgi:nitroreductase